MMEKKTVTFFCSGKTDLKEEYILVKNDNHKYTDGPSDQFILVKQM